VLGGVMEKILGKKAFEHFVRVAIEIETDVGVKAMFFIPK
jgi:hypothetical protein